MSDEDWEREDITPPATVASKWDDEDADDDVKDSWDADSDEDKPKPKVAAPVKKKKTLAQKIAEKKELEEQEALARQAELEETEQQKKERLAKSVMESDLENARALVGDLDSNSVLKAVASSSTGLDTMDPKSRQEFEDYAKVVMKKFSTFEHQPSYAHFVEILVREMVIPCSLDDTRKISSSLTAMINEKQKAMKDSKGKKKPVKKSLNTAPRGALGDAQYDGRSELIPDEYDDAYDFM
ncbi:Eukaryotic translation initiation factor 3 subunit J [Terramyces sp. JEL0728]|nr:Eukaryotic translation initiation factor 3 subunit J [Terramyces sp. JEL0728]